MTVRGILLFAGIALAGCRTHNAPALPSVDVSRFQGETAKAIGSALASAQANPNDVERVLPLCMVLHAHEQFQAAGQCYARAYALDEKRFSTLYRWAHALASNGSYTPAAEHLRQALALRPDSIPARLKLAEVLTDSGDAAQAAELYRRVLAKTPEQARAHYGLGRTVSGEAAVPEFQKALELFPRYGAAQFALAAAYRRKGNEAQAEQILLHYERDKLLLPPLDDPEMAAVRSLNVSATGLMQRAADYAAQDHFEEALPLYERAVATDPKLTRAYVDLISLYGRLHRDADAEQAYRRATALDPNESDAYYNFGVFCYERGRTTEAKTAFEHTARIQPHNAEALNNLGAIVEQQGNWDEAAALYRRAVAANSSYPLAHFHLGRIYANQKKYALAVEEFERSLEPKSDSTPAYLYALAATHARAGHRQRAIELLRTARAEAQARGQQQVVASIDRDLAVLDRQP